MLVLEPLGGGSAALSDVHCIVFTLEQIKAVRDPRHICTHAMALPLLGVTVAGFPLTFPRGRGSSIGDPFSLGVVAGNQCHPLLLR